jgi:O-antigen/teichoic acid export membrane protein
MNNIFANAGIIAVVYSLIKFVEMRMILKESRPVKELLRDSIIVYISTIAGMFIIDQMGSITTMGKKSTNVFVGNPEF